MNKTIIKNISAKWAINIDMKERTVGFLDRRYAGKAEGWEFGQPVSTYYIDTILGHKDGCGLDLYGEIPSWKVPADEMAIVKRELVAARNTIRI